MKAVVDDKIPFIQGEIEKLADEVVYLPGKAISKADVLDADVLVVRTRTHCNRDLLEGTRVRFIATATIGYDHIDTEYLREAGIQWTNCPGCNATSVGQYVHNCLLLLQRERGINLSQCTLGIVGVGHVGKAVLQAIQPLGCRVLLNDPPRAEREGADGFATLTQLLQECDIITCHTPLITEGNHPTYHLIDAQALAQMKPGSILINAGRGEVVDNLALEQALDNEHLSEAIIDTWEGEPLLNLSLLNKVYIGTPHVAGYSADGKANATRMSLEAIALWMGREVSFHIQPPALPDTFCPAEDPEELALQLYDPRIDSRQLKENPEQFEQLRGNYPLRRESFN